jgi:hypothetical protein
MWLVFDSLLLYNIAVIAAVSTPSATESRMPLPTNRRLVLVLPRTFKHSIILTLLYGLLAVRQQHEFKWMIP